jgi:hypothetical protein
MPFSHCPAKFPLPGQHPFKHYETKFITKRSPKVIMAGNPTVIILMATFYIVGHIIYLCSLGPIANLSNCISLIALIVK